MAGKQRPRREPRKPKKPMTRHHRDAKDCPHPAGSRLGQVCSACGATVGKRS